MTNQHEHLECEHEVKYCKKCDVAYCVKCGREWTGSKEYYPYYWPIYPYEPYRITYGPNTSDAGTYHAH